MRLRHDTLVSKALWWACVFLLFGLTGCAAQTPLFVPLRGSGTVTLVEGGLVETMVFDGRIPLNMQVSTEHMPEHEYLAQPILTIGRFSTLIGSGFANRSDIYFESTIGIRGQDSFVAGGNMFRVIWSEADVIPSTRHPVRIFSVTIEQLTN